MFELNIWGLSYYGLQLENRYSEITGIHTYELAGTILVFLRHAGTMLQLLGYSGPLLLETKLTSILDVPLLQDYYGAIIGGDAGSTLDDDVAFSTETNTHALIEKRDGVAMDVLRRIFFALNSPMS